MRLRRASATPSDGRRLSARIRGYWTRPRGGTNVRMDMRPTEDMPRVLIVGGGFGGIAAAKALRKAPVQLIIVDRTNHHVFQPLLYQVAISELTPGQIGSPIRGLLRKQRNTTVILGEVTGVDKARRCVFVSSADRARVPLEYDYLILATGARHSYFAHPEFEQFAPGLKSLADAVAIRNRLRSEFRRIDPTSARIVLVDAGSRVLGTFSERLAARAKRRLERLGVQVRLGQGADHIDDAGVVVAGERIATKTVIWTAGVAPSPAAKWLAADSDRAGRVRVEKDLTVAGHPEIFVVGDTASLEQDGRPLPGVAQVAMQQGRYVGRQIRRRIAGRSSLRPFRYFDKGSMAVVGKGFAVLQTGKIRVSGLLAWFAWAAIHLEFLAQSNLRVSVFLQWVWTYLTGQRGSRLIIDHHAAHIATAASDVSADVDGSRAHAIGGSAHSSSVTGHA